MSLITGAQLKFMAAIETTPGTENVAPGSKAKEMLVVSESLKATQAQGDSMLLSADPNPRRPFRMKKAAAGDVKTYVQSKSFGFLAACALGSNGYSVTGAGPYVHTIKPGTTDVYLDLDVEIPFSAASKWKRMVGAVVNTMSFGFGSDGAAETTFGFMGPDVLQKAATYTATPTDYTDEVTYENVMLDGAELKLDTVAYGKLLTLDGSWNWNRYADDYRAGAVGARNSMPRKRATLKGKCRLAMEAVGDWDLVRTAAVHSLTWKWAIDADTYVKFTLPEVTLSRTDPAFADDNPLFLDVEWTASKDSSSGTSIEIEVGSAIADYLV